MIATARSARITRWSRPRMLKFPFDLPRIAAKTIDKYSQWEVNSRLKA